MTATHQCERRSQQIRDAYWQALGAEVCTYASIAAIVRDAIPDATAVEIEAAQASLAEEHLRGMFDEFDWSFFEREAAARKAKQKRRQK